MKKYLILYRKNFCHLKQKKNFIFEKKKTTTKHQTKTNHKNPKQTNKKRTKNVPSPPPSLPEEEKKKNFFQPNRKLIRTCRGKKKSNSKSVHRLQQWSCGNMCTCLNFMLPSSLVASRVMHMLRHLQNQILKLECT